MSIGKKMLSILPLMLVGEPGVTSRLSDEELDEIMGLPSASTMRYGRGYNYSGNRVNLTEEELTHVRSLSKKERKEYMKNKRQKKD